MRIHLEYGEGSRYIKIAPRFKEVVKEIGFQEKKKLGEICFIFVSEKEILRINREFLKHDYCTDVITFSNNIKLLLGGDIFICPEIVYLNAVSYRSDNYTEMYRVMIHGILHLVGYNDGTDEERKVMRGKEECYLEVVKMLKLLN